MEEATQVLDLGGESRVVEGRLGRTRSRLGDTGQVLRRARSRAFGPDSGGFHGSGFGLLQVGQRRGSRPQAIICADPFHLVKLVGDALDVVRRELWQELRRLPDGRFARDFKGSRWALLKNPEDMTERQQTQLAALKFNRGGTWRADEIKEQFRAIFDGDLEVKDTIELLDRGVTRALRSRLASFVKVAHTTRQRRTNIVNALEQGISNGRVEGINTKVCLLIRRAYGFHSAEAAPVMLACGPVNLILPHERVATSVGK